MDFYDSASRNNPFVHEQERGPEHAQYRNAVREFDDLLKNWYSVKNKAPKDFTSATKGLLDLSAELRRLMREVLNGPDAIDAQFWRIKAVVNGEPVVLAGLEPGPLPLGHRGWRQVGGTVAEWRCIRHEREPGSFNAYSVIEPVKAKDPIATASTLVADSNRMASDLKKFAA